VKLLIDTNILIPLDPATQAEQGESPLIAEVYQRAQQAKAEVYYHPASKRDFARDPDVPRRRSHELALAKYLPLPSPPLAPELDVQLGSPAHGSNDWVDNQLVIALKKHAVELLITNDGGLRRKARRLGLEQSVLSAGEALQTLRLYYDEAPPAPPALTPALAHELDENDRFFDSFAADYDGFKDWLLKAKKTHRQCWYAKNAEGKLDAACIVKHEEDDLPPEVTGKVLKICMLKVAEPARGRSLGEQLFKAVFGFAYENRYDSIFVTLFEDKQERLVEDLEDFGFQLSVQRRAKNEAQMWKLLSPPAGDTRAGLDAHVAFGPRFVDFRAPVYAVPIEPRFVEQLFPEQTPQTSMMPQAACANAMRKAYLSGSRITPPPPGSVLVFYRSQMQQGVVAIGVVEASERHSTADSVASFVGKRTVYTHSNIEGMLKKGDVLAMRFREARLPRDPIRLAVLKARGLLKGAPQSITPITLTEEDRTWLNKQTLA
jgi:GNAT superfamily N-acetyltransferase